MARINISIPDQLKAEMDALNWVNWSALAKETFDRECRKQRRIDPMNTDLVVERLRASYEGNKAEEEAEGYEAGVDWASQTAEYSELLWLEKNENATEALHDWLITDNPFNNNYYYATEFWEGAVNLDGCPSLEFVTGFVKGALAVWLKVKDNVRT